MWQWFALDHSGGFTYYAKLVAPLALLGCVGQPGQLVPGALPSLDDATVARWIERQLPEKALRYDLRWVYATQQGHTRGRAAIRFVPPDSIRFDYRAPFGRSGAAVIIGDEVIWSEPEAEVGMLVQTAPLFWALIGIPRSAPDGFEVAGVERGVEHVWRYSGLVDTLTYVFLEAQPTVLRLEMRQAGDVIGTVETEMNDMTGYARQGTIRFPQAAAIFRVTVREVVTMTEIDDGIWKRP